MIKKIDIAGLQLDNYTVREMLMRVDRRISEKILTTIEEVNMDTLALAESDEEVKQALEACDYTVIADEGDRGAAECPGDRCPVRRISWRSCLGLYHDSDCGGSPVSDLP